VNDTEPMWPDSPGSPGSPESPDAAEASNSVLAIAHRAGNSLADLQRALDLGADVIEADVHSYHGRLEVRHLKTMGPLPLLWDQWELRSARAQRFELEQLLLAADQHEHRLGRAPTFMLDLKGHDPGVGEQVARQLHATAPERPVLVCTRYWPALDPFEHLPWARTIRSARTRAELARLLARPRPRPRTGDEREYGASVHKGLLTPDVVKELHERVQVVMTWPVNDVQALDAVLGYRESGTIGVISDELPVLRHLLATR
jgi:glycerophosphoryl diester phosphodiesterase